jgi:hypothetical protein
MWRRRRRREVKRATPREFVKVWQGASSSTEVARKLNMSGRAVWQRVRRYRKRGVPLKDLPAFESWEWLAQFADDLRAKGR